ncbi:MAG: hypothetical protein U9R36_04095, partial [Elusimicrobiota bacterium]|nr:hypothetical protein [Elusimicrobiota bacterium]
MKKYLLVLTAAVFLLSGCENNNIYSWSHAEGGDSSPEALLADARKAESDGDYEKALEYYKKIL